MAPKRPSHLDQPPAAASSEEEEVGSTEEEDEEEDGSSTEDEQQSPHPIVASPLTPSDIAPSSDSDTESESDEPIFPQPLASKPMDDASNSKKTSSSKPSSASNAKIVKRPNESEPDVKDSKRAKKDSAAGIAGKSGDESKGKLFQRLWSEDDEIEILKGMIEYSDKKGADPIADMNALHDFIKKLVDLNFSKAQLTDKIRRLKKKYGNNADKGKKGSNPHEQNVYELSKKIWGNDGILASLKQPKSNQKAPESQRGSKIIASLKTDLIASPKVTKEAEFVETDRNLGRSLCLTEMIRFHKNLGMTALEESLVKKEFDLIGSPKRLELEEKWKELHMAELEFSLKRTELIQEQTKLVLDAYKSSDH